LGFVGTSSALRSAIQNSVARGVVYVAAAGNSWRNVYGADGVFGTADDTIPAAYPEVITVSSMNDNDGISGGLGYAGWDDTLAYYSNFGQKIDLAAPGTTYTTALVSGRLRQSIRGHESGGAHVSGAAALYVAANGRATVQPVFRLSSGWSPLANRNQPGAFDRHGRPCSYHEPLVNAAGGSNSTAASAGEHSADCCDQQSRVGLTSALVRHFLQRVRQRLGAGKTSRQFRGPPALTARSARAAASAKCSAALPHPLTASVTDAGGLTGSAGVTFTVQGAPPPPPTVQLDVVVAGQTFLRNRTPCASSSA
jgi:hypothetical protein